MKSIEIEINRDQWLTDVLPSSIIPSNVILFKTLPGIGATHGELLMTKRNSIIIEPNVPVIKGKQGKIGDQILGVCKGVRVDQVIAYLLDTKNIYKKLLVTPESYHKIVTAAESLNIDIYKDYFLLYDECDRTSADVDYRDTIIAPMKDFFKFKDKAFVSATATMPSDPKFKKQGFTKLVIKPTFDYSTELTLIKANNVFSSTKRLIEGLNAKSEKETYCIFFNSIEGIIALIKRLGIKESEYSLFCSTNKKSLLKANKYKNVKDDIDGEYTKYNFFTSRFYSAVDMYMKESDNKTVIKPIVIILTQLHLAEHTIIDPKSDAVQIVGRFRDGISKAYVISNINKEIRYRDAEDARKFLEDSRYVYLMISALRDGVSTEGGKEVLKQALELIPYSQFVMENEDPNYYMHDNFYYKEELKSLYADWDKLKEAYTIDHFKLTTKEETYAIDDSVTLVRMQKLIYNSLVKEVCRKLHEIKIRKSDFLYSIDNTDDLLYELDNDYPLIVRSYNILGMEKTIKIGTSATALEKATSGKGDSKEKHNFPYIKGLNLAFPIGTKNTLSELSKKMRAVIDAHAVVDSSGLPQKASLKEFQKYFKLSGRKVVINNTKGYEILEHLFPS